MSGVKPEPRALADEFTRRLTEEIGADRMAEVRRLNATAPDLHGPDFCHSHAFCDSNQIMFDAGQALGWEPDLEQQADLDLINAAWELALPGCLSEQRLAELAAIPDKDIDTSDIPEAGEEFFERAISGWREWQKYTQRKPPGPR